MQLTDVSDHARGPTAAGVAAKAALEAGTDVAECDAFAVAEVASCACCTHWVDATGDTTKHGFNNNATGLYATGVLSDI